MTNQLQLMAHQQKALDLCLQQKATLVALDVGTGKTAVGIGCLDENETNLIVVPASLKNNWLDEIQTWKPGIKVDTKKLKPEKGYVVVVSYNQLSNVSFWKYDNVIFDEAHYLKNPNSQRTKAASDLLFAAKRKILMTATPALNNVAETHNLCGLLGHTAPWGAKEIHDYMIKHKLMVRVKSEDVLDLEKPTFSQVNVELSSVDEIKRITTEIRALFDKEDDLDMSEKWDTYRPQLMGMLSAMRRHVGIAKIPDAIKHIAAHVETNPDEPIIVFAHHRQVLESLAAAFDAPIIYGGTSQKKRHEAVREFQEGKHTVIICSIQAAGVGLTLTKSHHVIFVEYPWVASEYDQAYGRAHRKTQTEKVQVVDLVSTHKVDQRHQELLKSKRILCDTIMDGNPTETIWKTQKKLIESILEAE